MTNTEHAALKSALAFQVDSGVDIAVEEQPVDRTVLRGLAEGQMVPTPQEVVSNTATSMAMAPPDHPPLGASDAQREAVELARKCSSLEELQKALSSFEGLAIRKTATNMVFSAGNPKARVMIVGEAPGRDEDLQGQPFVGQSGQLMDKALSFIGLSRESEDPEKSVYVSNVVNWRPPGNRTPSQGEIDVSLPFIEKHIALVKPQVLLLVGGTPTKALLGTTQGLSRLRGKFHAYQPRTAGLFEAADAENEIPALASFHPAYLLRSPANKRQFWQDLLQLEQKLK